MEKSVDRAVLIPIHDQEAFRNELASSLLAEKLIQELRRLRKENPNLNIKLDDDALIFFNDKQNVNEKDFGNTLNVYTTNALSKLKSNNGVWTNEHELLLSTMLKERFALANLLRRSNLEIEKLKNVAEQRSIQLDSVSKSLKQTHSSLNSIFQQNPHLSGDASLKGIFDNLNVFVTSGNFVRI